MLYRTSLEKVFFVISLVFLSFLYGAGVGRWQWFPYAFFDKAEDQARALMRPWTTNAVELRSAVYRRHGVQIRNRDQVQPGMTLVTSAWKRASEWKPGLKLIGRKGKVLHEWFIDRGDLFEEGTRKRPELTEIHGSYLFPGGDVVVNLEYVGMARLNSCGEVIWTLAEGTHHSIVRSEDGTFWVPGVSQARRIGSEHFPDGFPGFGGKPVWIDRILQVSADGKLLDAFNVLDVLYKNNLERYIPKYMDGLHPHPEDLRADVTHLNDVEPLPSYMADEYPLFEAGDLLVSVRNLHLVFVVDPETKQVKWHASDPFIQQHDPDFIGGGWIGVFDNNEDTTERGMMLGGSRIVALQPNTDSTTVRFPTRKSDHFYTFIKGKWQQLGNGNMLLTEAVPGRVIEVAPDGRTVWEWIHKPTSNSQVPSVSKASRHNLTRQEVASWPCTTVDSTRSSAQRP